MITKLDTITTYQTPEGIELNLALAGPLSRGLAWIIDLGIRIVLYIALALFFSWAGGMGTGLILMGVFLIEWFYPVFFEIRSGMTPGKKAIGIRVIHDDGTPVAWSSSLLRNLIRSVDLLPLFNMVGLVTMIITKKFQRLGDLAAGTVVVYHRNSQQTKTIPPATPQPPPAPLKLWEQRLILDFCERAGSLSTERRAELASLLSALAGDNISEHTILSYGNWFLKGKLKDESDSI